MIKTKFKTLIGHLIGHRDGFGFLRPDDGGEDIFVPNREMLKAMHGDTVSARLIPAEKKGRSEAQITEVLKYAQLKLVGRVVFEREIYYVVPEDNRIKHDIVIPLSNLLDALPRQIVTVEIINPPTKDTPPIGKIVEVIGEVDDPGMEIEIAVRKFGIPSNFPSSVIEAAKKLSVEIDNSEVKQRIDLRDLEFITIDGEDARDFDDAVYAEENQQKGWRLLVAIADVSAYVKCGDEIDIEAYKRSTSVYFPRKVVPMLPEKLSNEICSLKPNEDRLSFVCDMVISRTGKISAYQFYEAIICSSSRLTYSDAWKIISSPNEYEKVLDSGVLSNLSSLYSLLEKFSKYRSSRGSIEFETTETEIQVNDLGRIVKILPKVRNYAHRIIEECMIAANTCAADFINKKKSNCLYRIHEPPLPEKISSLKEFLKTQGLKLNVSDKPSSKDFSKLLISVKEKQNFEILQTLILRSMQQAKYSPHNNGHFALALEKYTHFTSPIRRYPDLLVHRTIKAILDSKKFIPPYGSDKENLNNDNILNWNVLGEHCSIAERRAEDASRDVIAWLKCQFMKKRVGEQLSGTVTAVTPFGLFITLESLFVEGLLHVSELGLEYFQHNEISHELRGERTGKRFKIYDKIQIQVLRVDVDSRRIEFSLAPKLFRKPRTKRNTVSFQESQITPTLDGFLNKKFKSATNSNSKKKKSTKSKAGIEKHRRVSFNNFNVMKEKSPDSTDVISKVASKVQKRTKKK